MGLGTTDTKGKPNKGASSGRACRVRVRVRAWELRTPRESPTKELHVEGHAGLGLGPGSYGHQGKAQQRSFKWKGMQGSAATPSGPSCGAQPAERCLSPPCCLTQSFTLPHSVLHAASLSPSHCLTQPFMLPHSVLHTASHSPSCCLTQSHLRQWREVMGQAPWVS